MRRVNTIEILIICKERTELTTPAEIPLFQDVTAEVPSLQQETAETPLFQDGISIKKKMQELTTEHLEQLKVTNLADLRQLNGNQSSNEAEIIS